MARNMEKAAVLGAGVMGAQIAAHLANAGIPVVLLDIVPPDTPAAADATARSRFARSALEKLHKMKPAPFSWPAMPPESGPATLKTTWNGSGTPTGSSRPLPKTSPSNGRSTKRSNRSANPAASSLPTRPGFPLPRWPKAVRKTSGGTFWARTSSIRRATCISSS